MMLIKAPMRGEDAYGSGAFLAPRGTRRHNGVDIACYPGSEVLSKCHGTVTKIGYPYSQGKISRSWPKSKKEKFLAKKAMRYVQVTDIIGRKFRYMYVNPSVSIGDIVKLHDTLGTTQDLQGAYPGITDHVHFEIKLNGNYLNPAEFLNHG